MPLFVSFCHSTFLLRIDDKWMELVGAYATTAFPIARGTRPPFSPCGSGSRRLWVPLSTITKYGLRYICFFSQILLLPLGIPKSFFLKFFLLVRYLGGVIFTKALVSTKAFDGDLIYGCCQVKGSSMIGVPQFHSFVTQSDLICLL